ncbi:hypothetical protein XANCAGTX0491_000607 [Xanthoria calcicola]
MKDLQASIHFLAQSELYHTEKPYALRYTGENEIAQTNIKLEKHDDIPIHDIRGREREFSLEKNGFTISKMSSRMFYWDFSDPERVNTIYLHEVATHLKEMLGARHVQIYEHMIRKRHPDFPISTGKEYQYDQPTSQAHIDTTPSSIEALVARLNGDQAEGMQKHHLQCINVWKPLRGPLQDWPLAVCDAASVDADNLVVSDKVYSDFATENIQVHRDARQRWYYLSGQQPDELLVFRQTDSKRKEMGGGGCPHSSFRNPLAGDDELPRESIEARAIVYYGDCDHGSLQD